MRNTTFVLIVLLITASCNRLPNDEIRKSWWLYGSGYHLSDRLEFNDTNLRGDTIYTKGKPTALILWCGKGMFRRSAILEIKDLKSGDTGIYHDKGPR